MNKSLATAVVIAAGFAGFQANATEGGGNAYPNGAEGFMSGALPPQGLYYQNYLNHYTVNKVTDADGDNTGTDINLQATADVSRFIYMTDKKLFGADWGMYTTIPLVHLSGEVAVNGTPVVSSTTSGLGDISISPLMLGWHTPNFHYAFALEVTAPTGEYNMTRFANPGRNYWVFTPVFVATYLNNGFEASAKFMYDFNGKNDDTDYKSGQEFHFDYAVGYHLNNLTLGVAGYYYQQLTGDKQNGQKYLDGYKGKAFAIGPAVKFDTAAGYSVELRYQTEVSTENKPEGDKFWLKFTTRL
ncbi:transporter [Shewanella avicenniae]|uniref:Transporter n=1 Tax=Shewanella avicenniae TaxID=2814294 RepID=A0ABX7QT63_9GAMM|nr:transporter [Shewanella avicenniae]QSX34207.1 transporter [Shewanella avicenniae]